MTRTIMIHRLLSIESIPRELSLGAAGRHDTAERILAQYSAVISDGANGVIAVWEEMESQVGATTQDTSHTWRIMAQRVDAKGNLSWGANGITICTNPENVSIEEPYATADGSGGAIVGWHQYPSGPTDSSSPEWVYAGYMRAENRHQR